MLPIFIILLHETHNHTKLSWFSLDTPYFFASKALRDSLELFYEWVKQPFAKFFFAEIELVIRVSFILDTIMHVALFSDCFRSNDGVEIGIFS